MRSRGFKRLRFPMDRPAFAGQGPRRRRQECPGPGTPVFDSGSPWAISGLAAVVVLAALALVVLGLSACGKGDGAGHGGPGGRSNAPPAVTALSIVGAAAATALGVGLALTAATARGFVARHPAQTVAAGAGGIALLAVIAIGLWGAIGIAMVVGLGAAAAVGRSPS